MRPEDNLSLGGDRDGPKLAIVCLKWTRCSSAPGGKSLLREGARNGPGFLSGGPGRSWIERGERDIPMVASRKRGVAA